MNPKKAIIHEFDPVLYPLKLWISITNNCEALSERFIWYNDGKIDIDFENDDAITGLVRQKDGFIGVLIVFENKKMCNIKNITHEASHAVDDFWTRLGERNVGHEANAYLIGWIAECIEKVKLNKL